MKPLRSPLFQATAWSSSSFWIAALSLAGSPAVRTTQHNAGTVNMVFSRLAATRSLRSGARGLALRSADSASRLNIVRRRQQITQPAHGAQITHRRGGLGQLQCRRDFLVRELLEVPHQDHFAVGVFEL